MERVHDDRRPRVAGEQRGERGRSRPPSPCACAGCAAAPRRIRSRPGWHRARRSRSGEISRCRSRDVDDRDAELLGDDGHRLLAEREAAGDERRVVAALAQAVREVGDVQRRPAHVQARDHPQDADAAQRKRASRASAVQPQARPRNRRAAPSRASRAPRVDVGPRVADVARARTRATPARPACRAARRSCRRARLTLCGAPAGDVEDAPVRASAASAASRLASTTLAT